MTTPTTDLPPGLYRRAVELSEIAYALADRKEYARATRFYWHAVVRMLGALKESWDPEERALRRKHLDGLTDNWRHSKKMSFYQMLDKRERAEQIYRSHRDYRGHWAKKMTTSYTLYRIQHPSSTEGDGA